MVQQRLGYTIKRAQKVLRSRMDAALEAADMTTPQYAALSILGEESGLSNAELARRCFLTPQTMHKIVIVLEEKGLVKREPHPTHGRKMNTLLTEEGQKLLMEAHQIVEEIESDMTVRLEEKEITQTVEALQKCIESLEAG